MKILTHREIRLVAFVVGAALVGFAVSQYRSATGAAPAIAAGDSR